MTATRPRCEPSPRDIDGPATLRLSEGLGPLVEYADKVRALLFGLRDSDPSCTVADWSWA